MRFHLNTTTGFRVTFEVMFMLLFRHSTNWWIRNRRHLNAGNETNRTHFAVIWRRLTLIDLFRLPHFHRLQIERKFVTHKCPTEGRVSRQTNYLLVLIVFLLWAKMISLHFSLFALFDFYLISFADFISATRYALFTLFRWRLEMMFLRPGECARSRLRQN